MGWSRLYNEVWTKCSSEWHIARSHYESGVINEYHNLDHIIEGYDYLERSGIPYDSDLDYAWLHHDIVNDDKPNKEFRSGELMLELYPKKRDAYNLIMVTAHHNVADEDWKGIAIAKTDLHQLTDPLKRVENFVKITKESMRLYECDLIEACEGQRAFLADLEFTMRENYAHTNDKFWLEVNNGLRESYLLAERVMNGVDFQREMNDV